MSKINVNATNSKMIDGKLFITGLKMNALSNQLSDFIAKGNTTTYPGMGKLYQYDGPFNRA
tara:strand:- start:4 stop:186 length:183 start_codon:yes stop_codon:yes gene_type:complete